MFSTLLIANRGEIACRIIHTARAMGLRSVAVYSDADAGALHVDLADEAVRIGPAPAAQSYLNQDAILDAALRTGAEAVHPGYGFLSENADFAAACAEAGLVFVGPPPAAIRAMGNKDRAKALMEQAGVPIVPGFHGDDQDPAHLALAAERIGYPVLIKAVAGGGGRGMRRVDSPADFGAALEGARREAANAFGDDRVLLERYILRPRHVEIQVFADAHGNIVSLFERDCSVQRRHQKVIEEAPAPGMTPPVRAAMGEAAKAAARAVGYVGAGTVEFIVDAERGLTANSFYFIEMNTRLQVEHPVTEMVTGLDLVAWQLQVAAGEPLPLAEDELRIEGHAIEARLYAEDPSRNFLPSIGRLERLRLPEPSAHLRIDSGVREGDPVSMHYDPMIAKLIVWDRDRERALARLRDALHRCEIAGVSTNAAFLAEVASHPAFRAGEIDTGFIDRHAADLIPQIAPLADEVLVLAGLYWLAKARRVQAEAARRAADPWSPWHSTQGWRLNHEGHDVVRIAGPEGVIEIVAQHRAGGGWRLALPGGTTCEAAAELEPDGTLVTVIDGARRRAAAHEEDGALVLFLRGRAHRVVWHDPMAAAESEEAGESQITAPMSGKIIQVLVQAGDRVRKGDALAVLEAMKMEHTLNAPADGVVETVFYALGDQVEEGAEIVALAAEE